MSRIEFALNGGRPELTRLIRSQLGEMIRQLPGVGDSAPRLNRIVIVGNTVMHHLFCGLNVACLAEHPFQTDQPGRFRFLPSALGWNLPETVTVEFLPCLGGFVGSDILAGIVATGLLERVELTVLMDLGTNGEVVVGHRGKILCASTAAGPAFEGARISLGMRACTGAISGVRLENGAPVCAVIGGGLARGICGSGLVDAVAVGLGMGWIQPNGRMTIQPAMPLTGGVSLQPGDVRELQLAKGAIAAGLRLLARDLGVSPADIRELHLAGAFGNYICQASAQRIGLLNLPSERIVAAGNTALRGAKMALFEEAAKWDALARRIGHVALNEDEAFQEIYAEEMRFPDA
jgi:uncharacterized 2Fe-2S/4Fe-4S cluster protein (DUF4445 family)